MTELKDPSVHTDGAPFSRGKLVIMRILKPRFSVLDLALAVAVMGAVITVTAQSRMSNHERQLYAAVFESPLPDVRLAEARPTRDSVAYKRPYEFTTNWFTYNIPVWEKALSAFRRKAGINYLEVGVFEGRSALWTLENILTAPTASLTCIDLFNGPYRDRFFANVERSGESGKVTALTGYSQLALRKLPLNYYDIIYIDGSHSKDDVLEDAVLSWRLLKEGGVMIFDDYRWARFVRQRNVGRPDGFLQNRDRSLFVQCFDRHFEVIHNSLIRSYSRKIPPRQS